MTDIGGRSQSFDGTTWKSLQRAAEQVGTAGNFLESQVQIDFAKSIQRLLNENGDLIVSLLLAIDTAKASVASPDQSLAIVDYACPDS